MLLANWAFPTVNFLYHMILTRTWHQYYQTLITTRLSSQVLPGPATVPTPWSNTDFMRTQALITIWLLWDFWCCLFSDTYAPNFAVKRRSCPPNTSLMWPGPDLIALIYWSYTPSIPGQSKILIYWNYTIILKNFSKGLTCPLKRCMLINISLLRSSLQNKNNF